MKVTAFLLAAMIQSGTIAAQSNELAPPTNLWAAQTSATTITLVWQGVAGAAQYRVFGPKATKGSAGTSTQELGTLSGSATRYVAQVTSPGMLHEFFIEAMDQKGSASKRAQFNPVVPEAKDAIPATVPAPSSVTATPAGAEVQVTWSSVPGATAYYIGRSVFPGGFITLCQFCPVKPTYVDTAVTAGAKHIYTVSAISPAGTSRRTNSNEVTPTSGKGPTPAPKGPSDLKATVVSPTAVELSWLPGVGASTLLIKRKVGVTAAQVIATLAGTVSGFLDHLGAGILASGVSYEIEALNAKGSVGKATVAIAPQKGATDSAGSTPPAKGPSDLKATIVSPTSVQLTWQPGVGASTFLIKRKVGLTAAQVIATLTGTVSSFLDHLGSGAFANGVSYEIEAVNAKGSVGKATVAIAPEKATTDSAKSTPSARGPSDLKATVTSPTTIRLTWSPGVVGAMYRVMRQASGTTQVIATLPGHLSNFLDHFPPGRMPAVISYWIEAADGKQASAKITLTTDPAKR